MTRIKIVKDYRNYRKGQVLNVSPNEAHGLTELGVGIVSKDMTGADYKQSSFRAKKIIREK